MPAISQNTVMSNARFSQSDILKFIQENGTKVLWRTVTGLDAVTKKGRWPGGKEYRYHMIVDPGAMAFSGLSWPGGTFAPADRATGIQGFCVPKYQTFTMYFDRILDRLSDGEKKAYIGHMKLEFEQKTTFQKSFMNLQQLMDGTGRMATPVGLGPNNTSTGASFTLASPSTLLKVKLSSADTATGSAAYLMEGQIISFVFPSYDEAGDGTAELVIATSIPRYLALRFIANGNASWYDAFRVVRVNQTSNEVYVVPARKAAPDAAAVYAPYATIDSSQFVQQGTSSNIWCAGTGTVTVLPYLGRKFDLTVPGTVTALSGYEAVFAPATLTGGGATTTPTAVFCVHPGFVPTGSHDYGYGNNDFSAFSVTSKTTDQLGRLLLGLGWDPAVDSLYDPMAIDVSLINPFMMTGIDTLLFNSTNLVQGVPRHSIQQYLPTERNNNGQPLNFNTLYGALVEHINRNRDGGSQTSDAVKWNLLTMNPITYSSLLSLSETDRRIVDESGIRGTGCKAIVFGNKKFELDQNSSCRTDRILGLAKDSIKMWGGEMDAVEADGQKSFLALHSSGRRSNAIESYYQVEGEMVIENPRENLFIRNFSVVTL